MIKRIISLLTAIIMVFSVSSVLAAEFDWDTITIGDNLIENGNFKNVSSGWYGPLRYDSSVSHDDLGGAGFVTGRSSIIDQVYWPNIGLEDNKTYIVSAWVKLKNVTDNENATISLLIDKAKVIQHYVKDVTGSSSEWKQLCATVTKETGKNLQVGFTSYTNKDIEFYIDDVSVKEIDTSNLYANEIILKGATAVNVPQSGVNKVHLRGTVLNQHSTNEGMSDFEKNLVWSLDSPATGVSIDSNGILTVEPIASTGKVTVWAKYSEIVSEPIEIEIRPALYKEEGNLFANGDFESVGLGDWIGNVKILSEKAADGGFSAFVEDGEKCGQYIYLKPGKKYLVTAMVNADNIANQFTLTADNQNVRVSGTTVTTENNEWHRISALLDTTALENTEKVLISVGGNSQADYYADSFFLAEMREEFKECGVDISYIYGTEEKKNLINGELTVKAELTNGAGARNLIVAAALYKDKDAKQLEDVSVQSVALAECEAKSVELTKKLNITDSSKQIVKVYVWNNNLSPVNEAEEFDLSDEIIMHVYPNGTKNDANNIFTTIGDAINKINQLKSSGVPYPNDGITIILHEGVYNRTATLYFLQSEGWMNKSWRPEESKPVTFKAAEGEDVSISGAKPVTPNFTPATQEEKNRLVDVAARDHLVKIDLKAQGLEGFGEYTLPGSFQLTPFVKTATTNAYMPELIINGKVMQLSRYPNKGDNNILVDKIIHLGSDVESWTDAQKNNPPANLLNDGFVIQPTNKRFLNWTKAENAIMYGYWGYSWADQAIPISEINEENGTIISKYPSTYKLSENGYFYVYNLLEEIDQPGEYYIDKNGVLYLYPPESTNINSSEIFLTQLDDPLIWFRDAHNIVFDGITFENTRGTVLFLEGGTYGVKNIVFKNCTFKNSGGRVCEPTGKMSGNGFLNCDFKDVNGGIGLLGGNLEDLTPGNNFVENCTFDNFSRIKETYNHAISFDGVGNRAIHNTITNAPHSAIGFNGCDHIIEHNDISNVLQQGGDMAAIYVGRSWISRGNKVRYNYIHDIKSDISSDEFYGQNRVNIYGIYLDDLYSGLEVTGNVFANIGHGGYAVMINGGRDNIVKNNAIINTYGSLYMTSIGLQKSDADKALYEAQLNKVKNTYVSKNYYDRFPELYSIMDNEPWKPVDNIFADNLMVNSGYTNISDDSKEVLITSGNQEYTQAQAGNVGFADYENKDYTLNINSEVFDNIKGFYQLTPQKAGVIED